MLSRDLLDLADQLAKLGSTRPKQAVLRRAISTAYYGVFHFLIEQATKELAGVRGTDANLRAFLARGVSHAGLKSICKSIGAGNWPSSIEKRIGKGALGPPPAPLRSVGAGFVNLQELRHVADYDPLRRFNRADTIIEVGPADGLVSDWGLVPDGDEKRFFVYVIGAASQRSDE